MGDLWAALAEVNKRITKLTSQVQELNRIVYEEWRKAEGDPR